MSTFCKRRSCKDLEKDIYKGELIPPCQNIARVQKCPDITILYSLFGLCLFICSSFCPFFLFFLSFCFFVLLSFCPFAFLSFYLLIFLSFFSFLFVFMLFCPFVFLSFCLFIFLFRNYSDQMSEGS